MNDHLSNISVDDLIDAFHDGYFSRRDGKDNPPANPILAREWEIGRRQFLIDRAVTPVEIERPEGYYHAAPEVL